MLSERWGALGPHEGQSLVGKQGELLVNSWAAQLLYMERKAGT